MTDDEKADAIESELYGDLTHAEMLTALEILAEASWQEFENRHAEIHSRFKEQLPGSYQQASSAYKVGFIDGVLFERSTK